MTTRREEADMLDRRSVLKGIAGVPLAAVLADPILARAAAATLETVTTKTAGGKNVSAAIAVPDETPAPTIVLIHEWWGLNDQIKSVAAEFANLGYIGLAVDLYGGRAATTRDGARALMQAVDPAVATETLVAWGDWLKGDKAANGKLATIGWCFGGGWSLNASIAMPVDATIVYYGRVNRDAADLAKLKGPVLGHFASRDKWINHDMVGGFEKEMDKADKTYTSHWYEADHAFANPTSARYDEADAKLAWERTRKFLKANL
jgi:carboxymethylenebutenolidase